MSAPASETTVTGREVVRFVDHSPDDLLVWLSNPKGRPFESTRALWSRCVADLLKTRMLQRTGDAIADIELTGQGRARVAELLGRGR